MRRLINLLANILKPETAIDRVRWLRRSGAGKWWR